MEAGFSFAQRRLEGLPVLGTHQVVEDGVEGGGQEVEAAGQPEENLVDGSVQLVVLEVDISETLDVKRGPGDEEQNDDSNCRQAKM